MVLSQIEFSHKTKNILQEFHSILGDMVAIRKHLLELQLSSFGNIWPNQLKHQSMPNLSTN